MATTFDIQLPHYSRGFHLITRDIISQLPALPESGLLVIFIKHTSAGLTINENVKNCKTAEPQRIPPFYEAS